MDLPKRQIEELQAMAQRLERTDNFDLEIESFSKFAEELKKILLQHAPNKKVKDTLRQLPIVDYKPTQATVANTFLKFFENRKNKAKKQAIRDASEIASKMGLIMWHWYE